MFSLWKKIILFDLNASIQSLNYDDKPKVFMIIPSLDDIEMETWIGYSRY